MLSSSACTGQQHYRRVIDMSDAIVLTGHFAAEALRRAMSVGDPAPIVGFIGQCEFGDGCHRSALLGIYRNQQHRRCREHGRFQLIRIREDQTDSEGQS